MPGMCATHVTTAADSTGQVPSATHVASPSGRLGPEVQVCAGLSLPPGCVDASFSLCPHPLF